MIAGLGLVAGSALASCGTTSRSPASPQPVGTNATPTGPPTDPHFAGHAVATDAQFEGGADPTAKRDSGPAIRAAVASGRPVYLPPGQYLYYGPGINHSAPTIAGAGQGATTVSLAPDAFFIDSDQPWLRLSLTGIRFDGGLGHIRNRFRGSNVNDLYVVSDCAFVNYKSCSISTNSSDNPYWKITRNIFHAADCRASMGIALSGLTDGTSISDNSFRVNRIHIKLSAGGNNTYITNNDFLRFGPPDGPPRIDVWFVPAETDVNAGAGMVLNRCKFGNEYLDRIDLRIVYADESAGPAQNERWPVLEKPSTGWIGGHTISEVLSNGIGDLAHIPLIRSTTSNIVGGYYGPITQSGSSGAPIMSTMVPLRDGGESNRFGPLLLANGARGPIPELVVSDNR